MCDDEVNTNWLSSEVGGMMIESNGTASPMGRLSGAVSQSQSCRIGGGRGSKILRYIGWTVREARPENPSSVLIQSGPSLDAMSALLKCDANQGAGMQMWFIPGGIPPEDTFIRLTVESTFGGGKISGALFSIEKLYLYESSPKMSKVEQELEQPASISRPTSPAMRSIATTPVGSSLDVTGGRTPLRGVLDGLAQDISRLRGVKPATPIPSPPPPAFDTAASVISGNTNGMEQLQHTLNDLRHDVHTVLTRSPPRERLSETTHPMCSSILTRLSICESRIDELVRNQSSEREDLIQTLEEKIFKRLSDRIDNSILALSSELPSKNQHPIPKSVGKDKPSPRRKTTTTTTTTTTTELLQSYALLDRARQHLVPFNRQNQSHPITPPQIVRETFTLPEPQYSHLVTTPRPASYE